MGAYWKPSGKKAPAKKNSGKGVLPSHADLDNSGYKVMKIKVPKPDSRDGEFHTRTIVVRREEKEDSVIKRKGNIVDQNEDVLLNNMEKRNDELDEKYKEVLEAKAKAARRLNDPSKKINHGLIDYGKYKKNFYIEVPEIARLTEEQVTMLRKSLDNLKALGKDVPNPIRAWSQCGLRNKFLNVIKRNNWEIPTAIQAQGIPAVMSGRDVIGIAKTGSGKTLAFLLPLMRHVENQPPIGEEDGPIAIILTPTRELALQITKDAKQFAQKVNLRVSCIYGGTAISEQSLN